MIESSFLRATSVASGWGAAIMLAITPIIVAADFGGVLWWTQYIAGLAFLVAIMLAIPAATSRNCNKQLRTLILLAPLGVWVLYAWFQVAPLGAATVEHLSEGSFRAQTELVQPFLTETAEADSFRISIAVDYSRHAAAVLTLLIGLSWASAVVFTTRNRIGMLLSVIAIGCAAHAIFGLYAIVYPGTEVFGTHPGASRFGCFVNRNNAALMLNIGVASGLGLLSWRLIALTGQEVDGPEFEVNDLIALVSDRDSAIGVLSVVMCMSGLLVCGSRGGLVAATGGILLALGWVRQRRGLKTVPVIVAATLLCAALLLIPLSLDLESLKRFGDISNSNPATVLQNGRLSHWRDGFTSALAYFPTGSGLGTYAYAYLPYQEFSSYDWYQHADNLWLELFVEQGIMGIILALCVLGIWIWSLTRLTDAADPIDQGLRVTGWYMVGVILLSQAFDFGLIIPANLFLVAILASACVARGTISGTAGGAISFPSMRNRVMWYGCGIIALSASAVAASLLKKDASSESVARRAQVTLPLAISDLDALEGLEQQVSNQLLLTPTSALYDVLSKIEYRRARLQEVIATNPETPADAIAAYQATGALARRTQASEGADASGSTDIQVDGYDKALIASEHSLRRLPLGMEARVWQVYLDFVHRDDLRTHEALVQLQQFYRNHGRMLVRLGRFAADSGETELAIGIWTSALKSDPSLAGDVIEAVQLHDTVDLDSVIIDDPSVYREVGRFILRKPVPDRELATRAFENIDCESCESNKEKAACHQLAADLLFLLDQYDQAFESYEKAISFAPTDADLRLHYIERLREQGQRPRALHNARLAREAMPEYSRFEEIIQEMANADIRDAERAD